MTSILDALTGLVGSRDVVAKIGSLAGTDERETGSLLSQVGPSILGGLADKAAEPGGSGAVFDAVRGADAGAADYPLGFLDGLGGGADSGLLQRLLPGLGGGSLGRVSALVLPLVLGLLKRRVSTDGLDAAGLGALLSREKAGFSRGSDSQFGGVATGATAGAAAGGLAGGAVGKAGDIARGTGEKVRGVAGHDRETAGSGSPRVGDVESRRGGGLAKWLVPLALVGALAFGGWWFLNRDGDVDVASPGDVGANVDVDAPDIDAPDVDVPDVDAPDVGDAAGDMADGAKDAANAAGDAASDATDAAGDAAGDATDAVGDAADDMADGATDDDSAGAAGGEDADADAPTTGLPATGR